MDSTKKDFCGVDNYSLWYVSSGFYLGNFGGQNVHAHPTHDTPTLMVSHQVCRVHFALTNTKQEWSLPGNYMVSTMEEVLKVQLILGGSLVC